jgi:alpha-1,3-mannosyltransferase
MRVLHVTPTYYPSIGGIETVIDCLSRETIKHGLVADIAHVASGLRFSSITEDGRKVWRIPLHGHSFAGIAPTLRRIACNYDLLHVHDPQLLSITANVRLFCTQIPAVLSTHGGFRHTQRFVYFKSFHERYLLHRSLRHYKRILATSENDYAYFSAFADKIALLENGIDSTRHAAVPSERRSLSNWLYWGRIARHKRLDLICDLAIRARRMGHPVKLTICGPDFDGTLGNLKKQIANAAPGVVRYIEAPNEAALAKLVEDAGVYVTASEYEGFGLTIIEAMSAGLPVIARDISPINKFVAGGAGLLLRFDDSIDDDNLLDDFLTNLPFRNLEMVAIAQGRAAAYGWNRRVSPFIDAYSKVLDEVSTEMALRNH